MVIAATTLTPAAFCSADDLQVIRGAKNAAAGQGRGDFYCRRSQHFGHDFPTLARRIKTYAARANAYKTVYPALLAALWAVWFNRFIWPVNKNLRAADSAKRARPLPPDYRRLVIEQGRVPRDGRTTARG